MSVRMRHTKSHTKNRRSHHSLDPVRLCLCQKCGEKHRRHYVCPNCGTYRGRAVIDVLAKLDKSKRKKKEKELAHKKEEKDEENTPLNVEKLSQKKK
jgi:large subunit ribosomal protein L32